MIIIEVNIDDPEKNDKVYIYFNPLSANHDYFLAFENIITIRNNCP